MFGAPGTGKSYTLNKEKDDLLGSANETNYERVTFHPDYSYANFVGTYKPVPDKDEDGHNVITYKYVPGPFMRIYVLATELGGLPDDFEQIRIPDNMFIWATMNSADLYISWNR